MPYGIMRKLLRDYYYFHDTLLIESHFYETTRLGTRLGPVFLGLTPSKFILASEKKPCDLHKTFQEGITTCDCELELRSLNPLESVSLQIFKRSSRQTIKVNFGNKKTRYFDLGDIDNRKIFWSLWCLHVNELNGSAKLWPYSFPQNMPIRNPKQVWVNVNNIDLQVINAEVKKRRWIDKHVYLGKIREVEDEVRPAPVPGYGTNFEFLYKVPELLVNQDKLHDYSPEDICNYDVYSCTYSGEPTSNITYTSIMTTIQNMARINKKNGARPYKVAKALEAEGRCPEEDISFQKT